ncbi:MAG: hypothetical protein ACC628_11580 [Pirellulaceae bacterium]
MDPNESKNAPVAEKVYAVPRRYDLTTLFVVSLAFAMLFGGIRAAGGPPEVFATVAGYVTVIGLSQAIFFRGKRPRVASVIAGVLFVFGAGIVVSVLSGEWWGLLACANPCTLTVAALFGYMVGTLIGGVFLVTDYCRKATQRFLKARSENRK